MQGGAASGQFPSFDLSRLRVMGVLQRIAVAYLLAVLVIVFRCACLQQLLDCQAERLLPTRCQLQHNGN